MTIKNAITAAAATAAVSLAALCAGTASAGTVVIDFEDQSAGTIITDQYAGVTITGSAFGAMIFDTDNFTGGDDDLEAPFRDADDNILSPGNILIVSEDGDMTDPDDRGAGGTISLAFGQSVTFQGFNVFDIDAAEGFSASFFDEGGMLIQQLTNTMAIGDNGFAAFSDLGILDVFRAEFTFSSSGAIDDLMFDTSEVPVPAAGLLFLTGAAGVAAARKRSAAKA